MSTIYSPDTQAQATLTPIAYYINDTLNHCEHQFNEWLFKDKDTSTFVSYSQSIGIFVFTEKKDQETIIEKQLISTATDSVIEKIKSRIFNKILLPTHWASEGIAAPNMLSKVKAFEICCYLFKNHTLIPDRIAPTKEEGVFLAYDTIAEDKTLIIEVYNDLESSMLVNDNVNKKILFAQEVVDLNFSQAVNLLNG